MDEKGIIIPNLALAGYRSFGKELQYFDQFAKINLFIGQNNAGKSNVLRFLSEIYPKVPAILDKQYLDKRAWTQLLYLNTLDQHHPESISLLFGIGENSKIDELPPDHRWICGIKNIENRAVAAQYFAKVLQEKAKIDGNYICWTIFDTNKQIMPKDKEENKKK